MVLVGRLSNGARFRGEGALRLDGSGGVSLATLPLKLDFASGRRTGLSTLGGQLGRDGLLRLSGQGADSPPPPRCASVSLAFTGRVGLDPARSAGNEVVAPRRLDTFVRQFDRAVGGRFTSLYRMLRGGGQRPGSVTPRLGVAPGGALLEMDGLSAGDGAPDEPARPFGLWASGTWSSTEDHFPGTAFDADQWGVFAGMDTLAREWLVLGVSAGYLRTHTRTLFNQGEQDSDEFTVAPYAAVLLSENLAVDLAGGFSRAFTDQNRNDPLQGRRIMSNVGTERWFLAGHVSWTWSAGPLTAGARAGLLWGRSREDGFAESDGSRVPARVTRLGQIRAGGELSWTLDRPRGSFEPFASLTFEHDYERTHLVFAPGLVSPETDRSGGVLGLGVRYYGPGGLSASLEWSRLFERNDLDQSSLSLLIRAELD